MRSDRQSVSGWGRFRPADMTAYLPEDVHELSQGDFPAEQLVMRGLGRSYGDAAQRVNGATVLTTNCVELGWVDRARGTIRADAGVSIGQIINRFAPKRWFVPVTPGTRHVTVGGAIAADIHGKNHHVDGSFGEHVLSMRLRLASDEVITVSPTENADLFWATVGGMGLTGIIVDATIQLTAISTTTVAVETQRFDDLDSLLDEMRRSDEEHVFSVAWVDLLRNARSVLTQGSFASNEQLVELAGYQDAAGSHRRPGTPSFALPRIPLPRVAVTPGVRAFNELWFRKAPAEPKVTGESITAFFHPLDAIRDWNRVYGGVGFVQWQCVVSDDSDEALHRIVDQLTKLPSYFTVLKRFGPGNQSPLSFPRPGWTLAVDLPATTKALNGLRSLDEIVVQDGGRIYLAKDARMSRDHFQAMYPRLNEFKEIRSRVDPNGRFASDLSVRLGL